MTMSAVLKRAVIESGLPLLAIEKASGVSRVSLTYFLRGERTLRLDVAEKLAEFFRLELRPIDPPKKPKRTAKKSFRKGA